MRLLEDAVGERDDQHLARRMSRLLPNVARAPLLAVAERRGGDRLFKALAAVSLVAGLAFGGFRILMKRIFPDRVFDRPDDREIISLHLGDTLWLTPQDIGTCVNLYDYIHAVRAGRLEAVWRVAARGQYR